MLKNTRLEDIAVFVAAARTGSFTQAARRLDLSAAAASAVIKRLESQLGVRLFERSTRRVRLSEMGERLLPHAQEALAALNRWQDLLREEAGHEGQLSGPLRLSLPSDLGRHYLLGWIDDFVARLPEPAGVQLEVRISDRVSNLLEQPLDFAVRYGQLDDSGLIATPLAPDNRRVLCASPAYLAARGRPQCPADLVHHACLSYVLGDSVHQRWRFLGTGNAQTVEIKGARIADDGEVVRQWALAGHGIAYKSGLDVAADIAAGRLEALLPNWQGELAPLHWVSVSRHHLTPVVRRLVRELAAHCAALHALAYSDQRKRHTASASNAAAEPSSTTTGKPAASSP